MDKKKLVSWAWQAVGVGVIISYVLAMYAVISTSLVPGKYLLLVILIPGIITLLLAALIFKDRLSRRKKVATGVVSVLVIIANLYIFSVGMATTKFFDAIQDDGFSYEEYSIIAEKDRHIKLDTNNDTTGVLKNDANYDVVKAEVDERTKTSYKDFDEITSATLAMTDESIDTAAIKSSYVQLLKENTPAFYQGIEVLATFTVKVKKDTAATKTDITKPFVLYVSGIDTYGAISTVSRSDVNIIIVVNPRTHKILQVTTPRDYYVQLHGTTGSKDKLTHAGIYGIDMSEKTIEDLYGINIDYYMRVNFATLENIVNTLGGVTVYSDNAFTAGGYSFTVGDNQMNGKQALAFSRERYSFEDGDRTRGKNQQRVIEAIIRKMSTPGTIVNYGQILKSLEGTFQTNASASEIGAIMNQQMESMRDWQMESISVDGTGATATTYSMGATPLYVMQPDQASVDAAKQKIQQYMK